MPTLVFNYEYKDPTTHLMVRHPRKRTLKGIREAAGRVVERSAKEVEQVDALGFEMLYELRQEWRLVVPEGEV